MLSAKEADLYKTYIVLENAYNHIHSQLQDSYASIADNEAKKAFAPTAIVSYKTYIYNVL